MQFTQQLSSVTGSVAECRLWRVLISWHTSNLTCLNNLMGPGGFVLFTGKLGLEKAVTVRVKCVN